MFLSLIYSSIIETFKCLEYHLRYREPLSEIAGELVQAIEQEDITYHSLLNTFLKRLEIPCPHIFASTRRALSSAIDLAEIDLLLFCPYMLTWVATGLSHIDPGDETSISIRFNMIN